MTTAPAPAIAVPDDEPVLVAPESFFVRRVALDATTDAAGQVEIALEAQAPFGVAQLYYGYLPSTDGAQALVFATHRRLHAAEAWDGACAVLPGFLALVGSAPGAAKLRVWSRPECIVAAAWDGAGELPAHVLARGCDAATAIAVRDELVAELTRRLGGECAVEDFSGDAQLGALKGGGFEFTLGSGGGGRSITARFAGVVLDAMDVRDKAVLAERRAGLRRDTLLWRGLQATIGVLVFSLVLEVGLLAGGVLLRQQRAAQAQLAPEVDHIQTAQSLGTRIDEMSRRRLRPFEMLAALNSVRPPGLMFSRSVTSGQGTIEIEAQTSNADSVGLFESAVRGLAAIQSADARDVRLRDGLTTFQLTATFREGSLANLGAPAPTPPPNGAPASAAGATGAATPGMAPPNQPPPLPPGAPAPKNGGGQ